MFIMSEHIWRRQFVRQSETTRVLILYKSYRNPFLRISIIPNLVLTVVMYYFLLSTSLRFSSNRPYMDSVCLLYCVGHYVSHPSISQPASKLTNILIFDENIEVKSS